MKILHISVLILIFCFSILGQHVKSPTCPKISITSAPLRVSAGENISFTANVDVEDSEKLRYEWSISNGSIIEAINTPKILVSTSGIHNEVIIAKVIIQGLPKNCKNEATGNAIVYGGHPHPVDVYEDLAFKDEKLHLDYVTTQLTEQENTKILFIFYYSKNSNLNKLEGRLSKIEKYLTQTHKISPNRISYAFLQAERKFNTTIYILNKETDLGINKEFELGKSNWRKEIRKLESN
jgi:hypothetical protein